MDPVGGFMMKKINKTIVLTEENEEIRPYLPQITHKNSDELLVMNGLEPGNVDPYGSLIKDIIVTVLNDNIEEIYIIGVTSHKQKINKKQILPKLKVTNIVEENMLDWLLERTHSELTVKEHINLIKNHKLLPRSVSIYGFIVNTETKEFRPV